MVENIPQELKALHQWVTWKEVMRDGRITKPPFRLDGTPGNSSDPNAWASFQDALEAYQHGSHGFGGIGFTFSVYDSYAGIDLDYCRNPETGEIVPWAWEIIRALDSYTEVSPSGEGVHIIVNGRLLGERNRTGNIEMYDAERYFTFTGHLLEGTCSTIERRQEALAAFYNATFPKDTKPAPAAQPVSLDDAALLQKAFAASNGQAVRRLFEGDIGAYPSPSEADAALASHLWYWSGGDAEQVKRLLLKSDLRRDKMDRPDYLDRTIKLVAGGPVYSPTPARSRDGQHVEGATEVSQSLPFRTAQELSELTPETPDWIVAGLLAWGAITELDGKVKVGKSTFIMAVMKALLRGERFLGQVTQAVPVLYLTEERPPSFRALLERVGLADEERLHVLCRTDVHGVSWELVVALAVQHARKVGAGVLVVDTLSRWAGLKDDSENNAGAAMEAMTPLETAAALGLAVLIGRHDRKSGGDLGDSGRGSSAFSGMADIILSLRRADTGGHPSRRSLLGVGRFEGIPARLVVELQHGRYVALGDSADVERKEARAMLLDGLPGPDDAPGPMLDALVEQTGAKRSTLRRALAELIEEGCVTKNPGAGRTGRGGGYTLKGKDVSTIEIAPGHSLFT